MKYDFSIVVPLANESESFSAFTSSLIETLNSIGSGVVYMVVDKASTDNTLEKCQSLSSLDSRFITLWTPENKNVVDAYLTGYKEALKNKHQYIIEMDAGLSHDPRAIPMFLRVLNEGNECAFGSRFINGGSIYQSSWNRLLISKIGTYLSNILLGTNLYDATSGFQGFHAQIIEKIIAYGVKSKAHFIQTEIRYLLRETRFAEVPIHYRAPSPSVSRSAITNSIVVLSYYFRLRILGRAPIIN